MTTERQVRSFVRSRRREHDPRRISDRLIDIYMWALATVVAGIVISPLVKGELVPHPAAFLDVLNWLPVLFFALIWGVLRFGTWQGPVLFTTPELQWELSSPMSRRKLILRKLRRASMIAIGMGIAAGLIIALAAAAMLRHHATEVFVGASVALSLLGVMAVALSWHVERSISWRRVVEISAPAVAVVIGALIGALLKGWVSAVLWSGPWGWASSPVLAQGGRSVQGWVIQFGLLVVAAVAATTSAVATAQQISEEELWQRSEARSSASAALFFGNVRAARNIARQGRARGRFKGRMLRMARVERPWLTISARDILTFRRNPGLVVVAATYVAAAFVSGVAAGVRPILAVGVFVGIYAAASRLLEPLRLENDRPGAHRVLPWRWGTVLLLHSIIPSAILTILIWIGLGAVWSGSFVASAAILPMVVLAPFVAGTMVMAVAISASRRAFPMEMLISGAEQGALAVVTWLLTGPTLALIAIGLAASSVLPHLQEGMTQEVFTAMVLLSGAMAVFGSWLSTRKPRDA